MGEEGAGPLTRMVGGGDLCLASFSACVSAPREYVSCARLCRFCVGHLQWLKDEEHDDGENDDDDDDNNNNNEHGDKATASQIRPRAIQRKRSAGVIARHGSSGSSAAGRLDDDILLSLAPALHLRLGHDRSSSAGGSAPPLRCASHQSLTRSDR
jgi:hypothetical protein